jgi:hypothetical protein
VHAWLHQHQSHPGLPPRPQRRRRASVLRSLDWAALPRRLLGAVDWVAHAPWSYVISAFVWQLVRSLVSSASSCALLLPTQVGATTVRRISKERIYAFHNKHRGALDVQPEVQDSWSQVTSTRRRNHKHCMRQLLEQMQLHPKAHQAGSVARRCIFSLQVGRVVALRSSGEEVLVKWKGLDYGE